jgi:hypothetical protein
VLVLLAQPVLSVLRRIYLHDMLRLDHDVVLWVIQVDHLAAQDQARYLHLAFD